MTSPPDISLIVTIYNEWAFLLRTLRSIAEAAEHARQHGISVECVLVFDKSPARTRALIDLHPLQNMEHIQILDVEFQSVSRARNAGIQASTGMYTFVLDADDLISFSCLTKLFQAAGRVLPKTILTPRFMFGFDSSYFTVEYFSSDRLPIGDMITQHLYSARLFAPRTFFQKHHYIDVPITGGYAFEDWHLAAEAIASGYRFEVVNDTAWYYRIRPDGLFQKSRHETTNQIPPSRLFRPDIFHRIQLISCAEPVDVKPICAAVLEDPYQIELMAHANRIDPAILPYFYHAPTATHSFNMTDGTSSRIYGDLCRLTGEQPYDAVVFSGDPDLLPSSLPSRTLILSENGDHRIDWLMSRHPEYCTIDLTLLFPGLDKEKQDTLILKLLHNQDPETPLHFLPSPLGHRIFDRFHKILSTHPVSYYKVTEARGKPDVQSRSFLSRHAHRFNILTLPRPAPQPYPLPRTRQLESLVAFYKHNAAGNGGGIAVQTRLALYRAALLQEISTSDVLHSYGKRLRTAFRRRVVIPLSDRPFIRLYNALHKSPTMQPILHGLRVRIRHLKGLPPPS